MNPIFRLFLSIYAGLYRLSSGRIGGRVQGLNVLLLTTTGRKSGRRRTVGLGYFDDDGGYVVTASNAGLDRHPGWYFNLRQTPEVHVQIRDRSFRARAVVAEPAKRAALWNRLVVLSPGYAPYARRTKREIPMVTLYPL